MKKIIGLVVAALLLVATVVYAQDASPSKMKMLIGGELGFGNGVGTLDKLPFAFAYGAFDITPVFQFYPLKNEAVKDDLGFEIDARIAIGSNVFGTTFAMTPDFLVMYYFNKVPHVVPFIGAGVGFDLTFFPYPTGYNIDTYTFSNETYAAFRFDIALKSGATFNIPNTKVQIYLTDKFSVALPLGFINDVNVGVLYRL